MKKNLIYILTLLILSCSLKENKLNSESNKNLKIEVLNDLFLEIINSHYDKDFQIKSGRVNDSLEFVCIIYDKFTFPKNDFAFTDKNEKYYKDSLENNDFNLIYRKLLDSTKNLDQKLDLDKIKKTGIYKLKSLDKNPKFYKDTTFNWVATLFFSNIHFNEKKNKAMFLLTYHCGGDCGYFELVLCEKKNNKWTIIDTDLIWVS